MSQLSDAIREHLELKRQHGAREEEISQQEAEALGPVRREPDAVSPLAEEDDRASSSFDAETALIGSEQFHEESIELEEPEPEPFALEESEEEGEPEEPPGYHAPLEEPEREVRESTDEPLDADVASVFPEPDPTVPDGRMSAEDPPPIGPRPLVDEAPVVHDEPLAEDDEAEDELLAEDDEDEDELRLTGPPPDRESVVDPLEEPELLPDEPVAFRDPEPVGVPEPDPFATQPHALPGLEDEPLEDGRPALLDEDELEAFDEGRDERSDAGAGVADFEEDETEEPLLLEDTAGSLAYDALEDDPIEDDPMEDDPIEHDADLRTEEDPIEDDADLRPEDDPIEDDVDFRPEDDPPRSSVTPPPRDSGGFDFDA